jgi:ferritin
MFIAGFLQNKGLNNLASKFEGQWQEEINHSKQIYDFLVDMNAPISMIEVQSPDFYIESIQSIARAYLDREILTTTSLNEIKKICIEESDAVAEEFLRDMIKQQRAEYEEALDFLDKAELTQNNWMNVFIWDLALKEG